jgi:hypothetical protein
MDAGSLGLTHPCNEQEEKLFVCLDQSRIHPLMPKKLLRAFENLA